MPKVPSNYPDLLAQAGLRVHVYGDWYGLGGDADHCAIALHHTASSASTAPADDAAYCHHGSQDSPLYNVLVDRHGECWLLASDKSNNAGKISSVALGEAKAGRAGAVSASERRLADDTSSNAELFGISGQNDGSGEVWSDALVHAMSTCAAVTLDVLGLHAGHVSQHRVLTARKVDPCGPACPYDWQPLITAAQGGRGPIPEVREMWTIERQLPAGKSKAEPGDLVIGLPGSRGQTEVHLFLDAGSDQSVGASLWAAQIFEGGAMGLWDDGKQWELWIPSQMNIGSFVNAASSQIRLQHYGPADRPITVTLSGT